MNFSKLWWEYPTWSAILCICACCANSKLNFFFTLTSRSFEVPGKPHWPCLLNHLNEVNASLFPAMDQCGPSLVSRLAGKDSLVPLLRPAHGIVRCSLKPILEIDTKNKSWRFRWIVNGSACRMFRRMHKTWPNPWRCVESPDSWPKFRASLQKLTTEYVLHCH